MNRCFLLLWEIWYNRNNIVWRQKNLIPTEVIHFVNSFYMEWSLAYDVSSVAPAHASTDYSTAHWSRSPVGYVKCNLMLPFLYKVKV